VASRVEIGFGIWVGGVLLYWVGAEGKGGVEEEEEEEEEEDMLAHFLSSCFLS
jgi:hypothetical protein